MREGQVVRYDPKNEYGIIKSIRDGRIFVKFTSDDTAASCKEEDLTFYNLYIGDIIHKKTQKVKLVDLKYDGDILLFEIVNNLNQYSGWIRDKDVPSSYVGEYSDRYTYERLIRINIPKSYKTEYERELASLIKDMSKVSDKIKDI